jgi:hypothetical protein
LRAAGLLLQVLGAVKAGSVLLGPHSAENIASFSSSHEALACFRRPFYLLVISSSAVSSYASSTRNANAGED